MFLAAFILVIITTPLFFPIVAALGYDLTWWAVVMVTVTEMGVITPPYGSTMFLMSGSTGVPLGTIYRGVIPYLIGDWVFLIILLSVPKLATWLPDKMFG